MDGKKIESFVVSTREQVLKCVERLRRNGEEKVLGFDCEWDALQRVRRGCSNIPDLLQLGKFEGYCALIRLCKLGYIPTALRELLEDPEYIKVGVGIREDALKLWEHFGVRTKSILDLRYVGESEGHKPKGLAFLCKSVLGVEKEELFYKDHVWSGGDLSRRLRHYAAWDAVSAARVFDKLNHGSITRRWTNQWRKWSDAEYHEATLTLWDKYFQRDYKPKPIYNHVSNSKAKSKPKSKFKQKSKLKRKRAKV